MLRIPIFVLLFLFNEFIFSQILISGKVIDPVSREPLAFVNIGIKNKNAGTVSQSDGTFSITIPSAYQNDSLSFSLVGYETLRIPVRNNTQKLVPLLRKGYTLDEAVISTTKLSEKKFGLKKRSPVIHFIDGVIDQEDMYEIAQTIKLPKTRSKLTSVNLYINESNMDSAIYRINFYTLRNNRPAERLVERNILQTCPINAGWLHIDISSHHIYASGEIVVAIEFLPSLKTQNRVQYEVKLGGPVQSFLRTSSQGAWSVIPHHYLMHVTALVDPEEKMKEEENETAPSKRLFSDHVKDSFSVFIHLPKDYYSNKKPKLYPTVYFLDANAYFDVFKSDINTYNKELILVGIGYRDAFQMDSLRRRDYADKADRFHDFICKELVPYIDQTYRTRKNNRSLMGHSLGGYFTLYALYQDLQENTEIFKNYISISPSLDYANDYLVKSFRNRLIANGNLNQKKVYAAIGEQEESEDGIKTKDLTRFHFFVRELEHQGDIHITGEVLPGAGHMEAAIPGFEKGFQLILKNSGQ